MIEKLLSQQEQETEALAYSMHQDNSIEEPDRFNVAVGDIRDEEDYDLLFMEFVHIDRDVSSQAETDERNTPQDADMSLG